MSLLLKALKQAESANAGKSAEDRAREAAARSGDDARGLELEPLAEGAEAETEWVEPPGMLFGSGKASTPAPRPARARRLPEWSLVPVVALVAALVAIGYGVYLYFALQPPDTALTPLPETNVAAPVPAAAAPDTIAPLPPPEAARAADATTPTVSNADVSGGGEITRPRLSAAAPPAPPAASTAPVLPPVLAPRSAPDNAPAAPSSQALRAPAAAPARARGASEVPAAAAIQFQPDQQSALLTQAHAAYRRGALGEAQRLYTQAAARHRGIDALLGLAAIASVENREVDAQRLYREVLDINPRHAAAQAALLDLLGNTDGAATESRLKTLIDRDPSPQLYQTLGNLYADQKRWSDAQAAYFEAFRAAPDNADYAFNLAVSLDQLRQYAAALRYYEMAVATGGVHRFDRAQAEARIQHLKSVR